MLAEVSREMEEAALTLGASRWQTFVRVILPTIAPALATGFALAFARGVGEYGSVIFIAGNMPFKSEITPLLIVTQLEEYDYVGATGDRDGDADGVLRHAADPQPAAALAATEDRLMRRASHLREPLAVKALLIFGALAYVALMLLLPLGAVLTQAFAAGLAGLAGGGDRARRAVGDPADLAGRCHFGAAQHDLRDRRGLGDLQI